MASTSSLDAASSYSAAERLSADVVAISVFWVLTSSVHSIPFSSTHFSASIAFYLKSAVVEITAAAVTSYVASAASRAKSASS